MIDLIWWKYILIAVAAVAAGLVNALAGGGTLITFPILSFVLGTTPSFTGEVDKASNMTNTVALLPGYLGATVAQSKDLKGQKQRAWFLLPAALAGGLIGGLLLKLSPEKLFTFLVPFLILLASILLAFSNPVRNYFAKRAGKSEAGTATGFWAVIPVFLAAIYGGYFGAGLSVIVLAVLGLLINDTLTRLNALKQFIAFCANLAAALFFVFSGQVVWQAALVMMVGALLGGSLGGRLAGKIKPNTLRTLVVVIGVLISILYFLKNFGFLTF